MNNSQEQINIARHSAAHIVAAAIAQIFPRARFGTGPVVENGFYYDVATDTPITEADLKKIQKVARKLIAQKLEFRREELTIDQARALFAQLEQPYKLQIIDRLADSGETKVSVYHSGKFSDLCSGPHVDNTSEICAKALKITKLAGAYWDNDENNDQLTRIYGVLFESEEKLNEYLTQLEEAKKRDHRKLGKELELFTFSDKVGAGLPMFTPKGTIIRDAITEKIWQLQKQFGWQRVTTPHITKIDLYETSGHAEKFGDELFKVTGKSDTEFVMKPMNCPHHTQIFDAFPKSYKDLPVRYAENGVVYRDEQAGELLGLARVRHITQDDGHAFVTPAQIEAEVGNIVTIIKQFYTDLGMLDGDNSSRNSSNNYWVSLSLHDPQNPQKYMIEEDGLFLQAEKILEQIAQNQNLPYRKVVGEAAFYGPKLDFQFRDALGRTWQLATVQLDFNMPKRFGLQYTDSDGQKKTPIMIHRAIAGSLERFMAVMIEHTAGNFPFWMAPVQVRVLPIAAAHNDYAHEILRKLRAADIRAEIDDSSESFGKKVRNAKKDKLPYFIVIGDQDITANKLTLESRDTNSNTQITVEELLEELLKKLTA